MDQPDSIKRPINQQVQSKGCVLNLYGHRTRALINHSVFEIRQNSWAIMQYRRQTLQTKESILSHLQSNKKAMAVNQFFSLPNRTETNENQF